VIVTKTLVSSALVLLVVAGPATAHTVTFGWTDNNNGTVTLWNEHWHGDQIFPCNEGILCSDNGGLTISGDGSGSAASYGLNAYTVQWGGTLNNTDRDDMIADGTLLGYQDDPGNAGGGSYDDWLFTSPLVIGDGSWWFFTGTNCCIDTMSTPVLITLSGIGSVDPGTGPGGVNNPGVVPLPAALPLLGGGLALFGLMGWRRKTAAK
jgi:hypothetical protein